MSELEKAVVQRMLRVPAVPDAPGDANAIARQLDAALMKVGFKLSAELLAHLSSCQPVKVTVAATVILDAVRELVGDHVAHQSYFRDFPDNMPDTMEFWIECIRDALDDPRSSSVVQAQLTAGCVNLLDLPRYGRHQHSYEEMLAAHDELVPLLEERFTLLHLGLTLPEEVQALYVMLAGSTIPLSASDRQLLDSVAEFCVDGDQPDSIPMRENRAVINEVLLSYGKPLLADTVTDILRLACALSDGDVTLEQLTRFRSFTRQERRGLMAALQRIISVDEDKLADVYRHLEPWKRLGERLHPHEYQQWPLAQEVFAVARGDKWVLTLPARVELAFSEDEVTRAVSIMSSSPGMVIRNLDRVLRAPYIHDVKYLLARVEGILSQVSGRVLLSAREHFQNRIKRPNARIFFNRLGGAWATFSTLAPLDDEIAGKVVVMLDREISRRMPASECLVVDPVAWPLAIPLSDKSKASGFGIMPRGSVVPVTAGHVRFFIHWKQHDRVTDFDLSALLLNDHFRYVGHLSYTRLSSLHGVHSGDITSAPSGATEFIDVDLSQVQVPYLVPQVNIYSGEGFFDVEESFFGFMERTPEQLGQPFEARTVRMKSDLRGTGRVALPLVFIRGKDGKWSVKWLHLYMRGSVAYNQVESNDVSTGLLARAVVERKYLSVSYLADFMRMKAARYERYTPGMLIEPDMTYIGLERPENAAPGARVYDLTRLHELTPA